ncbi:penicillin-binding transpeptidase domain-containing protein [Lentzea sp. NPDC054927]
MGHDPIAFLSMFIGGWAEFSRLLMLSGLVLTVVNAVRFHRGRRSAALAAADAPPPVTRGPVAAIFRGGLPSLWWPLVLIWLSFLFTQFGATLLIAAVGLAVIPVVACGLRLLQIGHGRRDDPEVAGSSMAALLTSSALLLLGLLLTVRLVVAQDPTARTADVVKAPETWDQAIPAVFSPIAAVLVVLVLLLWANRSWRDRRRKQTVWQWRSVPAGALLGGIFVVFALFAAPRLNPAGAGLTIFGVATPEYGKIAYFFVLALILGKYGHSFRFPAPWKSRPHVWFPVVLFAAVGFASVLKHDMGPMIPLFVGTVAMIASVLVIQSTRARTVTGTSGGAQVVAQWRAVQAYGKPLLAPVLLLTLVGVMVMLGTSYISERGLVWQDPWAFTWAAECQAAPAGAPLPQVPAGATACQISYASAEASARSQVAQSLALIADGGLWGRGLADTTSGRLPAGSTDFVIAVIWNKLGGITVVLLAAVFALLGAALTRLAATATRAVPQRPDEPRPLVPTDPARLFVVGMVAALLGQFLFVLAATVNAVPHSGITAPFLSRGGQSTIALSVAVIIAIALHYVGGAQAAVAPAPAPVRAPWWQRPRLSPAVAVFAICVVLAAMVTVFPYTGRAENRPFCATSQPEVDADVCSTDRVAYERTAVQIAVGGVPVFQRDRTGAGWNKIGEPSVAVRDLHGLLDQQLTDLVAGGTATTLAGRLGPPSTPQPGVLELTVNPVMQTKISAALRSDAPGLGPLAAGVVALDARTGQVLASASAPSAAPVATGSWDQIDQSAKEAYARGHLDYGPRRGDGSLDESAKCEESEDEAVLANCWRWGLDVAGDSAPADADLLRYVGGDPAVATPGTDENRAFGRRYGLGSTFKVLVAMAFLRQPGTGADSPLPSPLEIDLGGGLKIRNATRTLCTGTVNGTITLANALAVSCNTAFVALARTLGWAAIRDTAKSLGFTVGPATKAGTAWLAGTPLGKDSVVPAETEPGDLGNNVLGGGGVEGTPLQMATVMAAIANKGQAVQPRLADAVTDAGGGARRTVTGESHQVLSADQAAQLQLALTGTTSPIGTAAALSTVVGRQLWVKTGTHDLYGEQEPPPNTFVRQHSWLTGYFDTGEGPVAFAVAVESNDERAGAARARWLVQQLVASAVEVRR